ncbi:MAG: hypothetical protein RR477_09080, partial [Raoultibacter sp.]
MTNTYNILLERFGTNEPILTCDIEKAFPGVPKRTLFYRIGQLVEKGEIERYENGVYYIPGKTLAGKTSLNPLKVIEKKYLLDGEGKLCGFWSGATLDNGAGITEQVPACYEVVTNNA